MIPCLHEGPWKRKYRDEIRELIRQRNDKLERLGIIGDPEFRQFAAREGRTDHERDLKPCPCDRCKEQR